MYTEQEQREYLIKVFAHMDLRYAYVLTPCGAIAAVAITVRPTH
jgi:hypothetical protein